MAKRNSAVGLASKLREAIAVAGERGLNTAAWEQRLKVLEQAEGVARRTFEFLNTRGWCLWRCHTLADEEIVVARDELVKGFPGGYPVYTEQELECLLEVDNSTLRLVHEAKKLAGATVISIEKQERDDSSNRRE